MLINCFYDPWFDYKNYEKKYGKLRFRINDKEKEKEKEIKTIKHIKQNFRTNPYVKVFMI